MAKPTSDLLTYISEYGSYSFTEKEFTAVDALVLSQIVYMRFDEVIPSHLDEPMDLDRILQHSNAETIFSDPSYGETYRVMLNLIHESRRFGSVTVLSYKNHVNEVTEHQFCGMLLSLPEDAPAPYMVAFRGTDATLVGWKENFNMAYLNQIPSQTQSVKFLNDLPESIDKFIVAGHSKGGNLAIYSSACANEAVQDRIYRIFSFDSPGFFPSFYRKTGYSHIENKIYKFIPEQSLIGLLFSTKHTCQAVQSYAKGIQQHDPLSWKIKDGKFLEQIGIEKPSYHRAQKVNRWIKKLNPTEREQFINSTYELFQSTNAGTVYELRKHPLQFMSNALHKINHWEHDKRRQFHKTIRKYWT